MLLQQPTWLAGAAHVVPNIVLILQPTHKIRWSRTWCAKQAHSAVIGHQSHAWTHRHIANCAFSIYCSSFHQQQCAQYFLTCSKIASAQSRCSCEQLSKCFWKRWRIHAHTGSEYTSETICANQRHKFKNKPSYGKLTFQVFSLCS